MALSFVACRQKENLGDLSGDDIHVGHRYEVLEMQAGHGMIRIIDESGDDYLYPGICFEPLLVQESDALRRNQVLPRKFERSPDADKKELLQDQESAARDGLSVSLEDLKAGRVTRYDDVDSLMESLERDDAE